MKFLHNLGVLKDRHVLVLSKKFTNVTVLRDVAVLGLRLEGHTIDATVYDNDKAIQEAAYKILQEWCKRQKNEHKAYTKLVKALKKSKCNKMAAELKESVENSSPSSTSSSEDD